MNKENVVVTIACVIGFVVLVFSSGSCAKSCNQENTEKCKAVLESGITDERILAKVCRPAS